MLRRYWTVAVLALLWNLIGVATYLGSVMSEVPTAPAVPAWVTGAYAISVFAGTFGSVGLLLRRAWVPRLFQVVLLLGAAEWLRTLYLFAAERVAFGQPWTRLALILGGVALFTALSGLVFRSRGLRTRYGSPL